jgi:hypothetical protein
MVPTASKNSAQFSLNLAVPSDGRNQVIDILEDPAEGEQFSTPVA